MREDPDSVWDGDDPQSILERAERSALLASGDRAMLLVWKSRQGQQLFLTLKKE